jgi:hypothetical protein
VQDVVKDLLSEPLFDDARGHFAGAKTGQPGLLRVAMSDAGDLGVDHLARDFYREVLLRVGDIDELGFH